jgi:hypothetical protein
LKLGVDIASPPENRDEEVVKTIRANLLTSSLDLNHRVEVKFHLAREGRSHADRQQSQSQSTQTLDSE